MKILVYKQFVGTDADNEAQYKVLQKVVIPDNLVPRYKNIPNVEFTDVEDVTEIYKGQDLSGKSLLISRFGGGGDLLVISAIARYLKDKYPDAQIALTADATWLQLFNSAGNVYDQWHTYPVSATTLEAYDYLLTFEGVVEGSGIEGEAGPSENIYDLFYSTAGIDPSLVDSKYKLPTCSLTKRTLKLARKELSRRKIRLGNKKHPEKDTIIAVQWMASSPIRTYPPQQLQDACLALADEGYKVVILGQSKYVKMDIVHPNVYYMLDLRGGVEVALGIIHYADLVLAPDSLFVHAAAAWDVPTVALYGPFTKESRTKYYPMCDTLEATADCAPCFLHGHRPCKNARGLYGVCWASLSADRVVEACKQALNNKE